MEFMSVTLGSFFDGIGGFPFVALKNGITPLWASEIDKFCRLVTAKRFPDMIQVGDIKELDGNRLDPVDIITLGSPCQDLSVAGARQGLHGERSGLFFDGIRLIREMRKSTNGQYPRFIVWENVAGAFSSNRGMDFKAVLEEIGQVKLPIPKNGRWATAGMVELSNCQIAWRQLDAQYWGVPQRRKRIFLVADFGVSDRCAGKILFEPKSLSRNFEPSGEKREETSAGTKDSSFNAGWDGYQHGNWRKADKLGTLTVGCGRMRNGTPLVSQKKHDTFSHVASTLRAGAGAPKHISDILGRLVKDKINPKLYENHRRSARIRGPLNHSPTLSAIAGTGGNNLPLIFDDQGGEQMLVIKGKTGTLRAETHGHLPLIFESNEEPQKFPIVFALEGTGSRPSHHGKGYSADGKSFTLNTVEQHAVAVDIYNGSITGDKTCTLTTAASVSDGTSPKVAYGIGRDSFNQGKNGKFSISIEKNVQPTMVSKGAGAIFCLGHDERNTTFHVNKAGTLTASDYKRAPVINSLCASDYKGVSNQYVSDNKLITDNQFKTIRRLTPLECERLQGFPDNWTKISIYCADSSRYKALGNSMAIPCADFVISRIVKYGYGDNK